MEKERKHQIIRAAIKRFQKHGLKKTTLDEVARDLRIGKATIYHYFNSKEELYFDCLKFETSLLKTDMSIIFDNAETNIFQKLNDYLILKESIRDKYKLLFGVFIEELKGTIFDDEKTLVNDFIAQEKETVFNVLKSLKPKTDETQIKNISDFLVTHSFALLFASQISKAEISDTPASNLTLFTQAVELLLAQL